MLSIMDETDVEREHIFFCSSHYSAVVMMVMMMMMLRSSHLCLLHFLATVYSYSAFWVFFFCVCPAEVTLALLDAATDKDLKVQEQVRKSLLTLGKQQPDRVLAMCQDYLLKHPKVKNAPV